MKDLSTIVSEISDCIFLDEEGWEWKPDVSRKELSEEYNLSRQELFNLACVINSIWTEGWSEGWQSGVDS